MLKGVNASLSKSQIKNFQNTIIEKELVSQDLCGKLNDFPVESDINWYESVRLSNLRTLERQNISFFVFENQKNVYWSDNTVSPNYQLLKQDSKLFFSGNAWYLLTYGKNGNREVFVLTLIKHQYPFENEYIKNGFQHDFKIDNNVEIYNDFQCDSTIAINDSNGEYLLSLSPKTTENEKIDVSREFNPISIVCLFLAYILLLVFFAKFPTANVKVYRMLRLIALLVTIAFGALFVYNDFYALHKDVERLFLRLIVTICFVYFVFTIKERHRVGYLFIVAFSFVSALLCVWVGDTIVDTYHGNINVELYNLLAVNSLSFVYYILLGLSLFVYFAFSFRCLRGFEFKNHVQILVCIFGGIVSYVMLSHNYVYVIFYIVTIVPILLFKYKKPTAEPTLFFKILLLVISVFFVEWAVSEQLSQKKAFERYQLANDLAEEQDPLAESFLSKVYKSTRNDNTLKALMTRTDNDVEIKNYLQKTYFTGLLEQYELECTVCGTDTAFVATNQLPNCENYFTQMLKTSGKSISDTTYYYVNNQDGNITYFDSIQYNLANGTISKLYIELHSKQTSQDYGYPTILLDKSVQAKSQGEFSSAKYKNGVLISKRGRCPYSHTLKINGEEEYTTIYDEQHHVVHLAYRINDQFTVVVSNRTLRLSNYLIWFPYIFMIFFILLFASEKLFGTKEKTTRNHSLSTQIRHSLVGLLVGSFLIVGVIGVLFINARNDRQQQNFLEEKMQSIANEFSLYYKDYDIISTNNRIEIQDALLHLADIHSTDINFYNPTGILIASSRPEIFQFRLLNEKMATNAYFQLIVKDRPNFSQEESIGNLQFMSSYTAVTNSQNQILGYLNLPNFSNQEEFTQQFGGLIVGLLNLFVILLIVSTILSVFVAKKITAPLAILQEKMKNVTVGTENEKIELNAPDELNGLLDNYNTMIDQLDSSADKLAKAEREMAWREMARQIAHEIKNPLTPMKLSIQLLNRSWDEKDEKFEKRLKSISKTMIEQIDTLAETATSFSDFAKLSKVNLEPININELIQNCVTLFGQEEHISVTADLPEEVITVLADKEKTMRLFNNLVKNAIQAIPVNQKGVVSVSLQNAGEYALIAVQDNGRGIDDEVKQHIFELHFTTKSTGSGFGLAICKNIVEGCKGEIWFETEVGVGTTFFVKLPIMK